MDKMCLMWGNFQPAFGVLSKKLRFNLRYQNMECGYTKSTEIKAKWAYKFRTQNL